MGGEELMAEKGHGTSATPVQQELRWDCDVKVADRICNFNRHYAEYRGKSAYFSVFSLNGSTIR